jgi:hypothetical protein
MILSSNFNVMLNINIICKLFNINSYMYNIFHIVNCIKVYFE